MAAIAGIASAEAEQSVHQILDRMAHRGSKNSLVKSLGNVTIGLSWPSGQPDAEQALTANGIVEDRVSESQFARAQVDQGSFVLTRDSLGISPLYFGFTKNNSLCFSSEVKGLIGIVDEVKELPPGSTLRNGKIHKDFVLNKQEPIDDSRLSIAAELRYRLQKSVEQHANRGVPFGAWLSGGLSSSIMAALARPYTKTLHTFTVGFEGAPDLESARLVARHINSDHHEMIPTFKEALELIPDVIFHLEAFDALLVRSSLMNYLAAKMASDFVPAVFSGEGVDELFAGYDYLKKLSLEELPRRLIEIICKLHNTALQGVDRCSA
ncbi:MAG: asparagine synthase, partial [Anaerolineaceae bacterium]|nr:asparagine synthase [Anaerolineaceae bacterium]